MSHPGLSFLPGRVPISIPVGDAFRLTATFTGASGAAVNMSTVDECRITRRGVTINLDARIAVTGTGSNVVTVAASATDLAALTTVSGWTWVLRDSAAAKSWLAGTVTVLPAGVAGHGSTSVAVQVGTSTAAVSVTVAAGGGTGSGVTAHSALTGLVTGDDHPQYVLDAEAPSFATTLAARLPVAALGGTVGGGVADIPFLAGVAPTGARVLLYGQTDPTDDGIYIAQPDPGDPTSGFTGGALVKDPVNPFNTAHGGKLVTTFLDALTSTSMTFRVVTPDNGVTWLLADVTVPDVIPATDGQVVTRVAGAATWAPLPVPPTPLAVDVTRYGADGGGTTDSTAGFEAAIAALPATGGVIWVPPGRYLLRRSISLPSGTTLVGAGQTATTLTKPTSVGTTLTADSTAGVTTLSVADGTVFTVGDEVTIRDTGNREFDSTHAVVTARDATSITLDRPTVSAYLLSNGDARVTTSRPMVIDKADIGGVGTRDVTVRDLTIDCQKNGVDFTDEFTVAAIHLERAVNVLVDRVTILNAPSDAYSDQGREQSGTQVWESHNKITRCWIESAGRHSIHFGSTLSGGIADGNRIINGGGMVVFYCAYGTNTQVTNNWARNCALGIAGGDERDTHDIIANNILIDIASYSVEAGPNAVISGNQFVRTNGGVRCLDTGRSEKTIIANNQILLSADASNAGLAVSSNGAVVTGNIIEGGGPNSTGILVQDCEDVTFTANEIVVGSYYPVTIAGTTSRLNFGEMRVTWDGTTTSNSVPVRVVGPCAELLFDAHLVSSFVTGAATVVGVDGSGSLTRPLVNGVGDNGTVDPAVGGAWDLTGLGIGGRRWDGTLVSWTDSGAPKMSMWVAGGWITLL